MFFFFLFISLSSKGSITTISLFICHIYHFNSFVSQNLTENWPAFIKLGVRFINSKSFPRSTIVEYVNYCGHNCIEINWKCFILWLKWILLIWCTYWFDCIRVICHCDRWGFTISITMKNSFVFCCNKVKLDKSNTKVRKYQKTEIKWYIIIYSLLRCVCGFFFHCSVVLLFIRLG